MRPLLKRHGQKVGAPVTAVLHRRAYIEPLCCGNPLLHQHPLPPPEKASLDPALPAATTRGEARQRLEDGEASSSSLFSRICRADGSTFNGLCVGPAGQSAGG